MLTLPEVIERPEQAYAYITFTVTMRQMQKPAGEGFPRLFAYLAQQGIEPVGAAFYNYRRINMSDTLDVEAGVAVSRPGAESGDIHFGTLPAGRYVQMNWHGHPDKLEAVTGVLIAWVRQFEQPLDIVERPDGDHFACRLEIYDTDPAEEPDMNKWVTRLEFKLRD